MTNPYSDLWKHKSFEIDMLRYPPKTIYVSPEMMDWLRYSKTIDETHMHKGISVVYNYFAERHVEFSY